MSKLMLEFNPDCMNVRDVKTATQILRDLIRKRQQLHDSPEVPVADVPQRFMDSFDTLTQNMEVS